MKINWGRHARIVLGGGFGALVVWTLLPPREIVRVEERLPPLLIGNRLNAELHVEKSDAAALRAVPVDDLDSWNEARRVHAILDEEAWTVANDVGGAGPDAYLRHFSFNTFGAGLHAQEAMTQHTAEPYLSRLRNILNRFGYCMSGPTRITDVQDALDKLMDARGRERVNLSAMTPAAIDALGVSMMDEESNQVDASPQPTAADIGDWKPSVDAVTGCWRKLPGLIHDWSDGEFREIRRYERGVEERTAATREGLASASFYRLKASPRGLHANGPRGYSYDRFFWTRISDELLVAETRGQLCPLLPTVEVYEKVPC